ncbi:MAG: hypothetical protein HOP23_01395 [Methylococcaceae bacterium]|nr:hypothetical protein [Methylococcaceae bacterium]
MPDPVECKAKEGMALDSAQLLLRRLKRLLSVGALPHASMQSTRYAEHNELVHNLTK